MKAKSFSFFVLLLVLSGLGLAGCAAGMKPADIYPHMPPGSSFERTITTPWGTTEVTYKTGPETSESKPAAP